MRFHFVMLLIVIFVSLGMHTMASAASEPARPADIGSPAPATGGAAEASGARA